MLSLTSFKQFQYKIEASYWLFVTDAWALCHSWSLTGLWSLQSLYVLDVSGLTEFWEHPAQPHSASAQHPASDPEPASASKAMIGKKKEDPVSQEMGNPLRGVTASSWGFF